MYRPKKSYSPNVKNKYTNRVKSLAPHIQKVKKITADTVITIFLVKFAFPSNNTFAILFDNTKTRMNKTYSAPIRSVNSNTLSIILLVF